MRIPCADAETVVEHHQTAIAGVVFSDGYDAIRSCVNRRAVIGGHINASVKRPLTVKWIQPLSEAIRDVPHHRPDRWSVRGVGKIHHWHELHAARGDGNN